MTGRPCRRRGARRRSAPVDEDDTGVRAGRRHVLHHSRDPARALARRAYLGGAVARQAGRPECAGRSATEHAIVECAVRFGFAAGGSQPGVQGRAAALRRAPRRRAEDSQRAPAAIPERRARRATHGGARTVAVHARPDRRGAGGPRRARPRVSPVPATGSRSEILRHRCALSGPARGWGHGAGVFFDGRSGSPPLLCQIGAPSDLTQTAR
jgi:hypothetical protein